MALEVLERLSRDVDRWVWSGALAAKGDKRLQAHENALARLGAKVPALAKVSGLAAALRSATGRKAPAALLQLDAAVQQLRAAQLELDAPEGRLKSFPECDVRSYEPVSAGALDGLVGALGTVGMPSEGVLLLLRTVPFHRDPRAWRPLLTALDNLFLSDEVVPQVSAIGQRVLPELERGLELGGVGTQDARLRAIGAIRKSEGAALYRKAIKKGSPDVQAAAIECLQYVSREELEQHAVAAFDSRPRRWEVRRYVPALILAGSDRALGRVVSALREETDDAWVAAQLTAIPPEAAGRFIRAVRKAPRKITRRELGGASLPLIIREVFIDWLCSARRPEAPAVLRELLTFPDDLVRSRSASRLNELGERSGLEKARKIPSRRSR